MVAKKSSSADSRLAALEKRVAHLEKNKIPLPTAQDIESTKNKLVDWARANPLAALGTAVVIGLILGTIL